MIAFGPVPSRRLGRSLGVNNIPKKICSYNCVYCQVGKTKICSVERKEFYKPELIVKEVEKKLKTEEADYITFVPDGEPTLDSNLGFEIELLKPLGRVAVITNSSLLFREDVRRELAKADLVSLKIDAISENTWTEINRPCGGLKLDEILKGMLGFSEHFKGDLITETMLVDGLNSDLAELEAISDFLKDLNPSKAYISVPIRPPAESWVRIPSRRDQDMAYAVFSHRGLNVEMLNRSEKGDFKIGDDPERGILSILMVHPMRREALEETLRGNQTDWKVVENLLRKNRIEMIEYEGVEYFRAR